LVAAGRNTDRRRRDKIGAESRAHIHLNDPNRRGPGEGELVYAPILLALAEGGYRGMAAIEPFIYEPDGPACAARAIGYVRGLLEAPRPAADRC
jgi:sugar phosphate isomerase/epimerase